MRAECRTGFADVLVPADRHAASVIAWMVRAREMANARDRADEDARSAERTTEESLLSEIRAELTLQRPRG